MGKLHLMSKQLSSGVCKSCFCFRGVELKPDPAFPDSPIPRPMPICTSTIRPVLGHCTRTDTTPQNFSGKSKVSTNIFQKIISQIQQNHGTYGRWQIC